MPGATAKDLKQRGVVVLIWFAVFIAACALPALHLQDGSTAPGWICLTGGWSLALEGKVAWLANIPLLSAALAYWAGFLELAVMLSLASLGLASNLLTSEYRIVVVGGEPPSLVMSGDWGSYLWVASMVLLLIASVVQSITRMKRRFDEERAADPNRHRGA